MSIQSEITRISGNVSAALAAVSAKGGILPAGATSDDLAAAIAAISGMPVFSRIDKFWIGEITITSQVKLDHEYRISHGLGTIPQRGYIVAENYLDLPSGTTYYIDGIRFPIRPNSIILGKMSFSTPTETGGYYTYNSFDSNSTVNLQMNGARTLPAGNYLLLLWTLK